MRNIAGAAPIQIAIYGARVERAFPSPSDKVPALVDHNADGGPLSIFESCDILTYLADTHRKFLAPSGHARWKAQEWLCWQTGGLGPMMGQVGFFAFYAEEGAARH